MVLSSFFPPGVHYSFTMEQKDITVLSPQELAQVEKYGTKRLTDFCTGRYCLRQATAPLGFTGDILIGERGMPLLPADITASPSHSKTLCGAIAAHRSLYTSLGFDIETNSRVHKEMWRLLFTQSEIYYLNSLSADEQLLTSTVYFSLKEAFYKLQFPLTHTYLDFLEVEITNDDGQLAIRLLRDVAEGFVKGQLFAGYMHHYNGHVITYCTLPARI